MMFISQPILPRTAHLGGPVVPTDTLKLPSPHLHAMADGLCRKRQLTPRTQDLNLRKNNGTWTFSVRAVARR